MLFDQAVIAPCLVPGCPWRKPSTLFRHYSTLIAHHPLPNVGSLLCLPTRHYHQVARLFKPPQQACALPLEGIKSVTGRYVGKVEKNMAWGVERGCSFKVIAA